MGVFYKETVNIASADMGTELKKIVSWFVEKAGLKVIETITDTASTYKVVVGAYGNTDMVYEVYNSGSHVYIYAYVYTSNGNQTFGGRSGYATLPSNNGYYYKRDSFSEGGAYTIYACVMDGLIAFGIGSVVGAFAKMVDACSGLYHYAFSGLPGSSNHPLPSYMVEGGVYAGLSSISALYDDNGYTRVTPVVWSSKIGFYGYLANPTDVCHIVTNGALANSQIWTEYTIAGHNFVGTGRNGFFLKIS